MSIGKQENSYSRTLLIHGTQAVIGIAVDTTNSHQRLDQLLTTVVSNVQPSVALKNTVNG